MHLNLSEPIQKSGYLPELQIRLCVWFWLGPELQTGLWLCLEKFRLNLGSEPDCGSTSHNLLIVDTVCSIVMFESTNFIECKWLNNSASDPINDSSIKLQATVSEVCYHLIQSLDPSCMLPSDFVVI
jgi:hypothetical protein